MPFFHSPETDGHRYYDISASALHQPRHFRNPNPIPQTRPCSIGSPKMVFTVTQGLKVEATSCVPRGASETHHRYPTGD